MKVEIRINWIIIPLTALILFFLSKYFMSNNLFWYLKLKIPSIAPPTWFIKRSWQVIYLFTIVCALIVWNFFEKNARFWFITTLFITNIILHGLWTYLFFAKHFLGYSTLCAGMFAFSTWLLMYVIWQTSIITGILLFPYMTWSLFAAILNTWIWLIN